MVYNAAQHPPPPPTPFPTAAHCLYIMYILFAKGGGGKVREKVERQQYTSIVPLSMGQQFTSWVENTNNECMCLQSIKSVNHNAAKSVNRSVLKRSRQFEFGVFIVHSSMIKTDRESHKASLMLIVKDLCLGSSVFTQGNTLPQRLTEILRVFNPTLKSPW
jgi:hypothetical protein